MDQFKPLKTSGNQKWNGAAPIFSKRAEQSINDSIELYWSRKLISLERVIITESSKIEDPITWVMKYFRVASVGNLFLWFFNKGIRDNKLISRPIQALNQEKDEIAMNVPIIIEMKNKILNNLIIKKKRIKPL